MPSFAEGVEAGGFAASLSELRSRCCWINWRMLSSMTSSSKVRDGRDSRFDGRLGSLCPGAFCACQLSRAIPIQRNLDDTESAIATDAADEALAKTPTRELATR